MTRSYLRRRGLLAGDILFGSLEKARGEQTVVRAIENGISAVMAFEKYGIL